MKRSCFKDCFRSKAGFNKIVILNLIQNLQRLLLLFVNSMRGRCQIKFGMTSLFNNGGFTLIELLVVVLIIGILAAVALPQYQTAVEKARATEAFTLIKSLKQARDVYSMSNPDVPNPALDELDIEIPGTDVAPIVGHPDHPFHQTQYFQVGLLNTGNPHAFRISDGKLLYTLAYYNDLNAWFCHVENGGDVKYASVCKSLGGTASSFCNNQDEGTCFRLP